MEATSIFWRTTSDELLLITKAVECQLQSMEAKAQAVSGHIDMDKISPDYDPLRKIYHQLLARL